VVTTEDYENSRLRADTICSTIDRISYDTPLIVVAPASRQEDVQDSRAQPQLSEQTVNTLEKMAEDYVQDVQDSRAPVPSVAWVTTAALKKVTQLSEEDVSALATMARDFVQKKATIVLSNATLTGKRELLAMIGIQEVGASWPRKPTELSPVEAFVWKSSQEDSNENRSSYMEYLRRTISLPRTRCFCDVQSNRELLSVEFMKQSDDSRNIRGSSDVAISKFENKTNKTIRNNIETLIELKKPRNLGSKDHAPQTVCEHLAAAYLNPQHPVVTVLTDLKLSWTFYWFGRAGSNANVSLYTLLLCGERAAMESKFILESLHNETESSLLPITLSDRLPFDAVLSQFFHNERKRARIGQGGPGDDSDMGNFPNEESKPSKPNNQSNSWGGNNFSRSSKTDNTQNGGSASGGDYMSMASALSLFAPPGSRDVANELDLLDMMDTNEQYETIRSFAMKHIVPYMKGGTTD